MQRSLRVAVLSAHTCPLATLGGKKTGGMNVYVRELSRELSRLGVEADIFTRQQAVCAAHNGSAEGVRVIHIPAGPPEIESPHAMVAHLPEFVAGVKAYTADNGIPYHLIHSHYWLSGLAARSLKREWGAPVIQMFHTLGRMKNRIALSPDEQEPDARLQAETEIMHDVDALVAATTAEKIQLMWLYGADMHKIHVIPPGVDTQTFHPLDREAARRAIHAPWVSPGDGKMLLFVGRMERLKGLDTLIRAMAVLKKDSPRVLDNLSLAVIGGSQGQTEDDLEFQRVKALRAELGLEQLVTFLGARSQQTLQYYYAAAEAVIMPSHYESFGMVALEAMACGAPVIASEVGGLAYLIQDGVTGFHVPDQDPVELAGKIRLLLENEELRREISAAAVRSAQDYAWPRIAEQIVRLYRETLGEKPEGRLTGRPRQMI